MAAEPGGDISGPARLAFFAAVREPPVLADRKATALLTANALVLTVVFFFAPSIMEVLGTVSILSSLLIGALAYMIVMVLIGSWFAFRAVTYQIPDMALSPAYFRHIADWSYDDYASAMKSMDYRAAIRSMLHYNYSLSQQAAAKFRFVRRSTSCFRLTLLVWMLVMILGAMHR